MKPLLLFDMDGTLILYNHGDTHGSARNIKAQMKRLAIKSGVPTEQVRDLNRMAHIWNTVRKHLEKNNIPDNDLMTQMNDLFLVVERREHNLSVLLPHTISSLQTLSDEGYEMGVVTSASRESYNNLSTSDEYNQFGSFFINSITRDDVRYIKPDPEPLTQMMELCDRRDVVYIGDSDHDGYAAQAANCNFVLINTRPYSTEAIESLQPDAVIENLSQLPTYLRN